MICVDFSQILIANASIGFAKFGGELTEDMVRHLFLNSIAGMRSKYGEKYGEPFILCCDGRGNWRKDVFPYYKIKRSAGRAKSPMDWDMIFSSLNKIYDEIEEYFPYHIIKVDGLEGDDVIAAMVHYTQENDFIRDGLMERRQDVLIISADKDFIQLQSFGNVSQYSPMQRKFLRELDPLEYRWEKVLKGDAGDGVMNVFSADDVFAVGTRQTPATKNKYEPLHESLMQTGKLPEDTDPTILRNFDRNKKLVDLVELQMPEHLYQEVIRQYTSRELPTGKGKLFEYFTKHGLKNLFNQIDKF